MNYFVIFGIIILAFVTSIALSTIVMNRLRIRHPDTWEALGRPKRINLADTNLLEETQQVGRPVERHGQVLRHDVLD